MCCSADKLLQKFFFRFGHTVYRLRWAFLVFPIVLTALLTTGFVMFEQRKQQANNTVYVFTPWNRRALKEQEVLSRLWPLSQDRFMPGKSFEMRHWLDVVITAADGGSVLRPHILQEISELNHYVMNNVSISVENGNFDLTYQGPSDLCLTWDWVCYENGHVELFLNREELSKFMDLSYPRGGSGDTPAYFGEQIGGVTVNKSNNQIEAATAIRMIYNLAQDPDDPGSLLDYYSTQYIVELQEYLIDEFQSENISLGIFHSTSLDQGIYMNYVKSLKIIYAI